MAKARRTNDSNNPVTSNNAGGGDDRVDSGNAQERIAARAYELYLARGGTDGQDWDDWLAAERELAAAATPRSGRTE